MSSPTLFIWGASGQASVVAEIILLNNDYELAGFIDNTPEAPARFLGRPVYRSLAELPATRDGCFPSVIAAIGDCQARMRIAGTIQSSGLSLASAVHPCAVMSSSAFYGPGTVIAAGAIVNPNCRLGGNVIVNTAASIDHDCTVGEGAHIGPGVHIGGWVTVGASAWLGIGATVIDRVRIGAGAIIGAGAVVVDDIPDFVLAVGVPAKPVRQIPQ